MKSICFTVSAPRWVASKALAPIWPGVYLSRINGLRLREIPVPALPADDWVLCQTLLGGVCGTDVSMVFLRQHPASLLKHFTSWPVSLGHENVARIVKIGPGVKNLAVGQRILVDPPITCAARHIDPVCPACREGRPSTCWNVDRGSLPPALGLGYNNFTGGSWSPYFTAHTSQVHTLPDDIPDEQAILIDPLACSLHAVLQDPPSKSEKIVIFGAGTIGMGVLLALRALDITADVTVIVRRQSQADLAQRCGANHTVFWTPDRLSTAIQELADITNARGIEMFYKMRFLQGGFDRLYDCTGKVAALADAQRLLHSGAKVVLAGTPQLGLADMTCFWFRELKITGATGRAIEPLPGQATPQHGYRHVINLIRQNKLDLSSFTVRRYSQSEYTQALKEAAGPSRLSLTKVAFDFRTDS